MEWKITYVGSAEDDRYDQVLDSVLVGPVACGSYRFVFQARVSCLLLRCAPAGCNIALRRATRAPQADPPKWRDIPQDDILGVTVILLTCAYNNQEFIRVGYYVNNEYAEESLRDNPPPVIMIDKVVRNILADKPRVTRFNADWGVPAPAVATPAISDSHMDDTAMAETTPDTHLLVPTGMSYGGMMV